MATATNEVKITRLERALRGGYWLAFKCPDTDAFGQFVKSVSKLPVSERKWNKAKNAWWVSNTGMRMLCFQYSDLKPLMEKATVERLSEAEQEAERLRKIEQARKNAEAARARLEAEVERARREAATAPVPKDITQAYTVLYVMPSAPKEVVQAVYRTLAKTAHVDKSDGDVSAKAYSSTSADAAMKRLNVAWDLIRKYRGW